MLGREVVEEEEEEKERDFLVIFKRWKERITLRKESIVIFLINVIFGFSLYNPAYIIIPF